MTEQVSWWRVHKFLESVVAQANCGPLPAAGTPGWAAMADADPRKLLALALDGEHWVLRKEIGQEVVARAGEEVHGGDDWGLVARQIQRRREIDEMRRTA